MDLNLESLSARILAEHIYSKDFNMSENKLTSINHFFSKLSDIEADDFMKLVEEVMNDDDIERCAQYIEDFYGIQDDDEVGTLTQIFVTGVLLGKQLYDKKNLN